MENKMPRAKNPATATADDEQTEVRTAEEVPTSRPEPIRDGQERQEQKDVEPDSHEDVLRRLRKLETRIF